MIYAPGRGNFEAAKTGEQDVRRQVGKAETLARSATNLRRCFRRFVGRSRKRRRREAASALRQYLPVIIRESKSKGRLREPSFFA